jgi:hypothetical protein
MSLKKELEQLIAEWEAELADVETYAAKYEMYSIGWAMGYMASSRLQDGIRELRRIIDGRPKEDLWA